VARLAEIGRQPGSPLRWPVPFVLPAWLDAWCRFFGRGELRIPAIFRHGQAVALAPLYIQGDTARLLGDSAVCDYRDVVAAPGEGAALMKALLSDLPSRGVKRLDLALLRPDSIVLGELAPAARRLGLAVECDERDLTQETNLPSSWSDYLLGLDGKQRHEVRRKLRRLEEAGRSRFHMASEGASVSMAMDRFMALFRSGRPEKARFMTPVMADYFRALAKGLAANGQLRLGLLDLNGQTVAVVFCFQLGQTMYLYNNAFDERFRALGVGLISKLLSIRAAIEAGAVRYDFLRGSENYKRLLGGRPTPLYRCRIALCDGSAGGGQEGLPAGGGKS